MAMNAQSSALTETPESPESPGLVGKLRGALQNNGDLLKNAGSLFATTGLTSLFGFVFWVIAARKFSPAANGYGSAATNAMQLLGTIGMFGLGTMLIGELPKRRDRGGLFSASLITSLVGSLLLGLGFAAVVEVTHAPMPEIAGTLPRILLFGVGTALTGAVMVFDEGTIGLLRGGIQLWRNLVMSAIRLALLPVMAIVLHDEFGVGIAVAFVAAIALSLIPSAITLVRGGSRVWHKPDWPLLRSLFKTALAHNWLNLAIATPPRLIPVIVTIVVSPSANAVFYDAFMIASFLFMVPVHLSTVLFAIASASPEVVAEKLRFVLRVSVMVGLPVMAVLAIGAHFALNIFGHDYAQLGTVPLWLLIVGYIPQMPKAQYIAVSRATGTVGRAALLLCGTAICELVAIVIGGHLDGLDGVCIGYLIVLTGEGLLTAPTVLRAAYARTAAGTGGFPAAPAEAQATGALARMTGPLSRMTGELVRLTGGLQELPGSATRQQSGLAALIALATAAVADGNRMDVATEVWRTGGFPIAPGGLTGPQPRPNAMTSLDLLGGQSAAGVPSGRLSYRHRQQAGIDALLSMADPDEAPGPKEPETAPRRRHR
jgi:O-antigen/teichoic acid export membrane protein